MACNNLDAMDYNALDDLLEEADTIISDMQDIVIIDEDDEADEIATYVLQIEVAVRDMQRYLSGRVLEKFRN